MSDQIESNDIAELMSLPCEELLKKLQQCDEELATILSVSTPPISSEKKEKFTLPSVEDIIDENNPDNNFETDTIFLEKLNKENLEGLNKNVVVITSCLSALVELKKEFADNTKLSNVKIMVEEEGVSTLEEILKKIEKKELEPELGIEIEANDLLIKLGIREKIEDQNNQEEEEVVDLVELDKLIDDFKEEETSTDENKIQKEQKEEQDPEQAIMDDFEKLLTDESEEEIIQSTTSKEDNSKTNIPEEKTIKQEQFQPLINKIEEIFPKKLDNNWDETTNTNITNEQFQKLVEEKESFVFDINQQMEDTIQQITEQFPQIPAVTPIKETTVSNNNLIPPITNLPMTPEWLEIISKIEEQYLPITMPKDAELHFASTEQAFTKSNNQELYKPSEQEKNIISQIEEQFNIPKNMTIQQNKTDKDEEVSLDELKSMIENFPMETDKLNNFPMENSTMQEGESDVNKNNESTTDPEELANMLTQLNNMTNEQNATKNEQTTTTSFFSNTNLGQLFQCNTPITKTNKIESWKEKKPKGVDTITFIADKEHEEKVLGGNVALNDELLSLINELENSLPE